MNPCHWRPLSIRTTAAPASPPTPASTSSNTSARPPGTAPDDCAATPTFQWSNGATTEDISGLDPGSYSVTITDANGCSQSATYSIAADNPDPQPTITGRLFSRYIVSLDGVFFWQRMLFGLAGPIVLSYLTWETAKIRATQSATGILYAMCVLVYLGELFGQMVLGSTGVPL